MENLKMTYGFSFTIILLTISPKAYSECVFPAIFNFGASNADTGGLSAAFAPLKSPYGQTYFQMPAGRYSDGRLIIDFIAESQNLPYLSAYLNSLGANFAHGANFATAGSTIRQPDDDIIPKGSFSPFDLQIQYAQFAQFIQRSQFIKQQGGLFKKFMPHEEYFGRALYTFDIGQNDLTAGFLSNKSLEEVTASLPDMVNTFSFYIKKIYDMGARQFWIHNTGPIGCLPAVNTYALSERDSAGCAKPYNEVAQNFNYLLKQAVDQLRIDLPIASFTYVDIYAAKYSLFTDPQSYGFELPLVSCCGYGGLYNFSIGAPCGGTITVDGYEVGVGSCDSPSNRVIWDGIHYTEAANKFVFDRIASGAFTDPAIPLNYMACQK